MSEQSWMPDNGMSLPSYPKSFFEKAKLNIEEDRAFIVMPFSAPHSKRMWRVLQRVCFQNELRGYRADSSRYPKPILIQILEEIGRARLIFGDLTLLNPNVLYEVGIAHCRSENVILISPKGEKLPFDLAAIRCIFYDPHSPRWPESLTHELSQTVSEIRKGRPPLFIEDRLERTLRIIEDLEALGRLPDEALRNETVWLSSFMSALAVGRDEDYEDRKYHEALLAEREALIKLGRRGCRLCFIINPPSKASTPAHWKSHALQRSEALLKFMRSNDRALRSIDWCVSPMRQKNIYIIGRISCIEGFKDNTERGYHFSSRQTSTDALAVSTRLFEGLFLRLCKRMLPVEKLGKRNVRSVLRIVTTRILQRSVEELTQWK